MSRIIANMLKILSISLPCISSIQVVKLFYIPAFTNDKVFGLNVIHLCQFSSLLKGNQYYFGAVRGELDYYFFVGDHVAHVLNELTQLTGRPLLKPKYVFGYHQGGYGPNYNDKSSVLQVARQYREAKIPCDGMHVDVDFQNNYRTFTHSPTKFPNPKEFFSALHDSGYKVGDLYILKNF